jgi:hypothetical protein
MKDTREHLQLFDLVARQWTAPDAVEQVLFNDDLSAVAFGCADGRIVIAATADASSPQSRIRRAVDTGQLSILPRSGGYPGPRHADHTDGRTTALGAHGTAGFLFGKSTGRMNTVSAGGLSRHLPPKAEGPILAAAARAETLAYAVGGELHLWAEDAEPLTRQAPDAISALRFSPDRSLLACGHDGGVMLWTGQENDPPQSVAFAGQPVDLVFDAEGRHLACCLGPGGLAVVDLATMTCILRDRFPGPVVSAGFMPEGGAVVASGAYRVAVWSLEGEGQPIATGRPGLVLVDRIAACPTRNLVAVGYANGLVSLAEPGRADEILLRGDTGSGVTALGWSSDGRMLAIGWQDGTAALFEFPAEMFKT